MLKVDIQLSSPSLGKTSPRFQSSSSSTSKSVSLLPESPRPFIRDLKLPFKPIPRSPGWFWLILPFLITYSMILFSPHTKVEETPAMLAVRDILEFGVWPDNVLQSYEHVNYPGPVPRSMIPSLLISTIITPLVPIIKSLNLSNSDLDIQILIRLTQATIFCLTLSHLSTTIHQISSPSTANFFLLFTLSQFHITYYAGRTLPNFLALPWVLLTFSFLLRSISPLATLSNPIPVQLSSSTKANERYFEYTIAALTSVATIVRLELAPIAVGTTLILIVYQRISVRNALFSGAMGGFVGLCSTTFIDGYFYSSLNYPIHFWPELSAAFFNVIQGSSSDWGIQPWWFYLVCLLKIGTVSIPLAGYHIYRTFTGSSGNKERMTLLLFPGLLQLVALTFVGHKEWRFIIYFIPLLNILAAETTTDLWNSKSFRYILRLLIISCILLNIFITTGKTIISKLNYPGGKVGGFLEEQLTDLSDGSLGKVWIPAAALHTGATPFTLPRSGLEISRPESGYERCSNPFGDSPKELWLEGYDWVITDNWDMFDRAGGWKMMAEFDGYRGIKVVRDLPFIHVNIGTRLAIMRRLE